MKNIKPKLSQKVLKIEDKFSRMIAALFERREAIINRGLGDSVVYTLGNRQLLMTKKGLSYG